MLQSFTETFRSRRKSKDKADGSSAKDWDSEDSYSPPIGSKTRVSGTSHVSKHVTKTVTKHSSSKVMSSSPDFHSSRHKTTDKTRPRSISGTLLVMA